MKTPLVTVVLALALALAAGCADDGAEGPAGVDGAACFDGIDTDQNGDGVIDSLDCVGADGEVGEAGIDCWDDNRNGVDDPEEDRNDDGAWDTADCVGASGADGADGTDGIDCWDLDGDGIDDEDEDTNGDDLFTAADCVGSSPPIGYAGSDECATCHADHYAGWENSGHPYKIVPVDEILDGVGYPSFLQALRGDEFAVDDDFFTDQASLISINANTFPSGGWDDVSYVIGGYGWKARFIGNDGYIITGEEGDRVQFNFPFDSGTFGEHSYGWADASSSSYHAGEQKPYTCGGCHTTGWVPDTDAATDDTLLDNQDGMEGIHGTWVEPGIGCEGCHGPSASHAYAPYDIQTPAQPEDSCQNCHIRGYQYDIDARGGYVRHHEQFEEIANGRHSAIGCEGCHDSHQPVRYQDEYLALDGTEDDPFPAGTNLPGIRVDCQSCHVEETRAYAAWAEDVGGTGMRDVACVDCHMPNTTKSGHAAGTYSGDVAGHLLAIDVFANFIDDPAESTTGRGSANPYVSLDWVCGGCHTDLSEDPDFDFYGWAYSRIQGVHGADVEDVEAEYVGIETCATCHEEHALNVLASGHPYKIVPADEAVAGTGYPEYVQLAQGEANAIDADFFTDQAGIMSIVPETFPDGWDDISYVIGGYGWKARFIGNDGYIITGESGDIVQFNFPLDLGIFGAGAYEPTEASGSTYHSGEHKPYTCGTCHTTGWVPDLDAATDGTLLDNQDGLEGIHGTWEEPGVTCEGCHGAGGAHAANPEWNRLPTPASADACGTCHTRGSDWTDIDVRGGYIRHHEQYEELTASAHIDIGCGGCHDPHRPVRYADDFVAADGEDYDPVPGYDNVGGIRTACEDCHTEEAEAFASSTLSSLMTDGLTCVGCHMPYIAKSGSAAGERAGDIRSHVFAIDATVDVDADLSLHTAGAASGDANRYVSLDWACGGCHADEYGTANDQGIFAWASGALTDIGAPH